MEDWLTAAARAHPDRVAIATGAGSLTYAQLHERAERRALALAGAGVRAGDRVPVTHPPGLAFAELLHALPRLGAVLAPGPPAEPPLPAAGEPSDGAPAHEHRARGRPHRDPHLGHDRARRRRSS